MESWASILKQIVTPLQLAALFLMLAAWVVRELVKSGRLKGSEVVTRRVVDHVFTAAIVALVLGLSAPLVASLIDRVGRDEEFRGVVLSTAGEPVSLASVSVNPIGQWTTNALGQFSGAIPRNQRQASYSLQVRAPNYKPLDLSKSDAELTAGLELRIVPAPPELIKEMSRPLLVGQSFGMPMIVPDLRIRNDEAATVWLSDISGTLSNDEAFFTLLPVTWTILNPFSGFAPLSGNIPIPVGTDLDLRLTLLAQANYALLFNQIKALPEYGGQQPCATKPDGGRDPLSGAAYDATQDYSTKHFAWKPGTWRFQMTIKFGQQSRSFEHEFTMSAGDVERLRSSIVLARQCLGMNWQFPLAQDGELANFLAK